MTNKIVDNVKTTEFIDNGAEVVVKQEQNITSIVDHNVKEYNSFEKSDRWSDNAFGNKVASIPLTVFQDLEKQGITRGFTILDHKRFKEFLNNPDNRVFRTRPGRI
jgi:hypothetical protein